MEEVKRQFEEYIESEKTMKIYKNKILQTRTTRPKEEKNI